MFLALWEYEVKPGCEERFEKVYGPEGDWAQLFRRDPHYIQTRLVREGLRGRVYLTMDFWETREAYEEFIGAHRGEYEAMDEIGNDLAVEKSGGLAGLKELQIRRRESCFRRICRDP
jgi:heme-degrading monooxygenase HmoA